MELKVVLSGELIEPAFDACTCLSYLKSHECGIESVAHVTYPRMLHTSALIVTNDHKAVTLHPTADVIPL